MPLVSASLLLPLIGADCKPLAREFVGLPLRASISAHPPREPIRTGADPILRQRIGPACAGADAAIQVVEMHVDFVAPRQIDRVSGCVKIVRREMADRELRRFIGLEQQPEHAVVSASQRTSVWLPCSCGVTYGTYSSSTVEA